MIDIQPRMKTALLIWLRDKVARLYWWLNDQLPQQYDNVIPFSAHRWSPDKGA